jgi:hypothetical protein
VEPLAFVNGVSRVMAAAHARTVVDDHGREVVNVITAGATSPVQVREHVVTQVQPLDREFHESVHFLPAEVRPPEPLQMHAQDRRSATHPKLLGGALPLLAIGAEVEFRVTQMFQGDEGLEAVGKGAVF